MNQDFFLSQLLPLVFYILSIAAMVLLIIAVITLLRAKMTDAQRAKWLLIVLVLPIAGPLAYLLWGRHNLDDLP